MVKDPGLSVTVVEQHHVACGDGGVLHLGITAARAFAGTEVLPQRDVVGPYLAVEPRNAGVERLVIAPPEIDAPRYTCLT